MAVLPDADEFLLRDDARLALVTRSVAFVEKYNPPDPPRAQAAVSSAAASARP
jgi:hypothetical protein